MRGRGRGGVLTAPRRKKMCEKGDECPYRDAHIHHQHLSEYAHPGDGDGRPPPVRPAKKARWSAAGRGTVLDQAASADAGPRKCTYCKRSGHSITKCQAPGADAERRRRAAKKAQKTAGNSRPVPPAPQPVGRAPNAAAVAPTAIPTEFVNRMRMKDPQVQAQVRAEQNDAYARSLAEDQARQEQALAEERAREEEEEMELARQLSIQHAREEAREARAELFKILSETEPQGWYLFQTTLVFLTDRSMSRFPVRDSICPSERRKACPPISARRHA